MATQRIKWLDGIRGLAIGWVLFVHAITIFTPNGNADFPGFWGLLFYGISGKLAVACCCVILGFFASDSRKISIGGYVLKRSLPFMLQILIIETVYYLLSLLLGPDSYLCSCSPALLQTAKTVFTHLFSDSILVTAELLPTFWCINDFVFGSILVFILQKLLGNQKIPFAIATIVLVIILFYFIDMVWISACAMGYLLRLLVNLKIKVARKPVAWLLLLMPIPWLIRRGECDLTYFYNGIACILFIYVVFQWRFCQTIFSFAPVVLVGTMTLEVFMLHVPIMEFLRSLLTPLYLRFELNTFHHALIIIPAMFLSTMIAWIWKKYVTTGINRFCQRIATWAESIWIKNNQQRTKSDSSPHL